MDAHYETTLIVLRTIVCLCSSIGSLMIISQVSRSRFNRSKPQQRLVLGISVCDLVSSIVWILSPALMLPMNSIDDQEAADVYWARGSQTTCSFQGFVIQLFVFTGALYQGSIQLQYLLAIKHCWSQRRLQTIEVYLHGVPWLFGWGSAITNLVLENYNPASWGCWISRYPSDCTVTYEIRRGGTGLTETDCIRGDNANIYQWVFFYGPLWGCILFCLFVMFRVYNHVYTTEHRTIRYKIGADKEMKMAREVKRQSLLYAFAFYAVWLFPTITRLIPLFGGTVHEAIITCSGATVGSQGIWNAIIYFRPRYKQCNQDWNAFQKVMSLMNSTLCYWVSCKEKDSDVIDVVVYADIGDNKAIELGQEIETEIDPPRLPRKTWAHYIRTSLTRRGDEGDRHRDHRTTI